MVSSDVLRLTSNGFSTHMYGPDVIISNGSKIYVLENTACLILSQSGIEEIITELSDYEYQNGQDSVSAVRVSRMPFFGCSDISANYRKSLSSTLEKSGYASKPKMMYLNAHQMLLPNNR